MSALASQIIAVVNASAASVAGCVTSLLSSPSPHTIRAIFSTEAQADSLRASHGSNLHVEILTDVDAAGRASVKSALSGFTVAFLVTPDDPARGMHDDVVMVENTIRTAVDGGLGHMIFGASWTARV